MKLGRFQYPIRLSNVGAAEHAYTVVAQQAPLSQIERFLPGVPGGEALLHRPSKVAHLGIVASAHPDSRKIEAAHPRLQAVKIPRGGHHNITLCGTLAEGAALIHVTQHHGDRMVGGVSVLVIDEKA